MSRFSHTSQVYGGSFSPIHLGHALLAITTQQTKAVDSVVLVPVYKHAVKRDLLPFDDRVAMCELAVESFGSAVTVSTIEKTVGESNGPMLRALKREYPPNTKFVWICGDDFIGWMDGEKGRETLEEVEGIILQRRLHRASAATTAANASQAVGEEQRFIQEPLDDAKLRRIAAELNLTVDFIHGELPHFSSTLVRRAPGHWRSFLTQAVVQYLDDRPDLVQQLIADLEANAAREAKVEDEQQQEQQRRAVDTSSATDTEQPTPAQDVMGSQQEQLQQQRHSYGASVVLRGLDAVHALQKERGRAGLFLSGIPDAHAQLLRAQKNTDHTLKVNHGTTATDENGNEYVNKEEVRQLAAELDRVGVWLVPDRKIMELRGPALAQCQGTEGWLARLALVEKFNPRIDVLGTCS